jgi:hypothetical protein
MSEKKREIKVICWKCDKRFTVELAEIEKPKPVFRLPTGEKLETSHVRGKTYIVKCPHCGADNEIKV